SGGIQWKVIPGIGRDGDGITSFPVTAADQGSLADAPYVAYAFYTYDTGAIKLNAYFSPTLNFRHDSSGLRYAISLDDEQPQIVSIDQHDDNVKTWQGWVAANVIIRTTDHRVGKAGKHTVTFWRVSPGVVLQKIVLDLGGEKPSYLGPPETRQNK
ncbi:MAG TPA: glycosyhydrolase, partial [Puia sp.]|nr:glycosyhydrolase [Puia sp.]